MDVLVLGGGYAGVTAAVRIARGGASVTLIDANDRFSERVRFHEVATGRETQRASFEALLEGTGARFEQARVERVDPEARTVVARALDGSEVVRRYDRLVVALGSVPGGETVPGAREHALSLTDHATARDLAQRLDRTAQRAGTVAVVGGGLTGIEMATEIAERHPTARVVWFTAGSVGEGLSAAGADYVRATARALRIDLREHTRVRAVRPDAVELSDGALEPCDLCVWTASLVPSPTVRACGLPLDERGQIRVDRFLRVPAHPDVFAIGDAAALDDPGVPPLRMACATAMPMADAVAPNVLASIHGTPLRPFRFAYAIQCISLGRTRAIVQPVRRDDTPLGWVITGRMAVWIKEWIVRLTVWGLTARAYSYPRTGLPARRAPALPSRVGAP